MRLFQLLVAGSMLVFVACAPRSEKTAFPYPDVPAEHLEEASDIPTYWVATNAEVADFLKNNVCKG